MILEFMPRAANDRLYVSPCFWEEVKDFIRQTAFIDYFL